VHYFLREVFFEKKFCGGGTVPCLGPTLTLLLLYSKLLDPPLTPIIGLTDKGASYTIDTAGTERTKLTELNSTQLHQFTV